MFLLIAAAAPSDNTTTVISIHLMFLLIRYPIRSRWIRNIYFNTSHVSINRVMRGQTVQNYLHFNTSHVSINHGDFKTLSVLDGDFNTSHVSINQFRLKNERNIKLNFNTSHVSINPKSSTWSAASAIISIHLMFLLILFRTSTTLFASPISIHLMFLLIPAWHHQVFHILVYFNTSHVSINQEAAPKMERQNKISIHLMFLLIRGKRGVGRPVLFISIHLMFLLIKL